ncbi:hypothetical protein [Streptomyces indiaensis]|uniref:hypothetical protein n=1 Tax=Streptomyces indiaensis TaxID=284033 RepID=UPI001F2FCC40|nr:hypothetical protein [Streptomyces indiaensis]MCF1648451.1 hypothetical protein [Streptomyces indiaensis]
MSIGLQALKRLSILLLVPFSLYVLRTPRRSTRLLLEEAREAPEGPIPEARAPKEGLDSAAFREPYKIAIGAFYAICVQRAFETSIQTLDRSPLDVTFHAGSPDINVTSQQIVLICQLLAMLIWMGLYYINNVRIYLLIPEAKPFRRKVTHVVLTVALAQFYFLGATIGSPSVNQLLLILGILVTDAVFPLVIGAVRSRRTRFIWVVRGSAQTAFVLWILLFVPASHYGQVRWSVIMLLLVLVQLMVIAPLESHYMRKRNRLA